MVVLTEKDQGSCGTDPVTGEKLKVCLKNQDGSYSPPPDRRQINLENALKGKGLEIAYVKHPLLLAFMMVQGSGSLQVHTPEGKKLVRLNNDGTNGRPLSMLRTILQCDSGKSLLSIDSIRDYLDAHLDRREKLMALDQSYVFFKPGESGTAPPVGALGIPISAGHTLATDSRIVPYGSVSLFRVEPRTKANSDTSKALDPVVKCQSSTSLAISQDTGSAIKGAHADIYLGEGEDATNKALAVHCPGSLFVALPKGAGSSVPNCDLSSN